jgi:hypothetical protein
VIAGRWPTCSSDTATGYGSLNDRRSDQSPEHPGKMCRALVCSRSIQLELLGKELILSQDAKQVVRPREFAAGEAKPEDRADGIGR